MHSFPRSCLRRPSHLPVCLAMLLCVALGCGSRNKAELAIHGKLLSHWVDQLGNPKLEGGDRKKAALAVQSIGTNALPFLITQIKLGSAIDGQRRAGVVAALETLGKSGDSALPALTDIVIRGDERSADTALWALSRMGDSGIGAMTNILVIPDADDQRRSKVVRMLHSMGKQAHVAVPAMLAHLRSNESDYDAAFWAGCGAARASLEPSEVIHSLTTNLLEGGSACRYGSASGLRLFGREAVEAVPALRTLLSDTNDHVRYAASNALSNIQK